MLRSAIASAACLTAIAVISPAEAATTWTTGCVRANGTVSGLNPFRSIPQKACTGRGQQALSFQTEVPGVQFGKRRRTLLEPGEIQVIEFAPFKVSLELSETTCRLVLEVPAAAEPLSVPGPSGSTDLPAGLVELASAGLDDIAGVLQSVEYIAATGRAFRVEDLKVVHDEEGCLGVGTFRSGAVKTFYAR